MKTLLHKLMWLGLAFVFLFLDFFAQNYLLLESTYLRPVQP